MMVSSSSIYTVAGRTEKGSGVHLEAAIGARCVEYQLSTPAVRVDIYCSQPYAERNAWQ